MEIRYYKKTVYLGDFIMGEANEYKTVLQYREKDTDEWKEAKEVNF